MIFGESVYWDNKPTQMGYFYLAKAITLLTQTSKEFLSAKRGRFCLAQNLVALLLLDVDRNQNVTLFSQGKNSYLIAN
jgi:hypothetical protein